MPKQQFLVNTIDTFKAYIYKDNRKIVPTSATLTVTDPGTTTEVVSAAAMTIASDGLLSYNLTATDNDVFDENYKALIAYVFESTTFNEILFYDVVHAKLSKVVVDDDILAELPSLTDLNFKVHGTADFGSTTTIVDTELADRQEYPDDYFTGGKAYSITRDETRDITDFVSTTGTLTTIAYTGAISNDKYIISRSFSREIQRSFEKIDTWIVNLGRRSALILDPYDLRETHIYLAVSEVCKGLMTVQEEFYSAFWMEYKNKAEESFRSIKFKYDESDNGLISSDEEKIKITRRLGRA